MIGETRYMFETGNDGKTVLLRVTKIGLDGVELGHDSDGNVLVTEATKAAEALADKYRLEPSGEGNLWRLVLLRDINGFSAGSQGGLVSGEDNLSQKGECWIDQSSRVTGRARVRGNARVYDSALDGNITVTGGAVVDQVTVDGLGYVIIDGVAQVRRTEIVSHGQINIGGDSKIIGSRLTAPRTKTYTINGGCMQDADITSPFEVLSTMTPWGWLTTLRTKDHELAVNVGCQDVGDIDEVRQLAQSYSVSKVQLAMLEGFLQMVVAAMDTWSPQPEALRKYRASLEPVKAPGDGCSVGQEPPWSLRSGAAEF